MRRWTIDSPTKANCQVRVSSMLNHAHAAYENSLELAFNKIVALLVVMCQLLLHSVCLRFHIEKGHS